jgi:aryl-alcohol dehydrogenase-like predicted oxidoreductase
MTRVDEVTGIGLGTAQFAFKSGSHEQSIATVRAALTHGVTLIDTALAYTRRDEESTAESIVAAALHEGEGRDEVIVATKGGHWRRGDDFPIDGSEAALRAHCEISLRTLRTDALDLYQLHHVDPAVPLEVSVSVLERLRSEGKVRQIGLSNVSVAQLEAALAVAPIASVQNRLSFDQLHDLPTARRCAELGVRYLAYLPLGGPDAIISDEDPRRELAVARGVSIQALTLAWLQALSPAIIPLVGSSRPETIIDSAGSAAIELSPREVTSLSDAAGPRARF